MPTMFGYNQISQCLEEEDFVARYESSRWIVESEITTTPGADLTLLKNWVGFVHRLCQEQGGRLFTESGGLWGFEAAEPILSIFYANRVLVIISLRYSSIDRKGTGQILVAYEFLEDTAQVTNVYQVYSTGPRIGNMITVAGRIAEIAAPIFKSMMR